MVGFSYSHRSTTISIFIQLFLISLILLLSCSKKNPVSPQEETPQDGTPVQEDITKNIVITPIYEDVIPTAFVNSLAKLIPEDEGGLIQVVITNSNSSVVQLKIETEIENYSNVATKTLTFSATSTDTVNFIPLISDSQLQSITENKTVNYRTQVILIEASSEKEIYNQTHTAQMLAKDVMIWQADGIDLSKFCVLWVTPHIQNIDELISKAVKRNPKNQFIGYQQSPTADGYSHISTPYTDTVTIPAYTSSIVLPITIESFYVNYSLEGSFNVTSGNDIKVTIEDSNYYYYQSGQVSSGSFYVSLSPGTYYLVFDNIYSFFSSKTVTYSVTITYDEDLIYPQVKAIYDALKYDYDVMYVNSPISYPEGTQKIRLPNDALTYGSANCIDGTVLFASAIENIAFEPIICLVPEHAFVGWRRWTDSNTCEFLETTMIGSASYDEALEEGTNKFNQYMASNQIQFIDIKECRSLGLTPLMKRGID